MIIVDASVLIAHLDDSDAHHDAAGELLLGSADQPLGTSPVTLAEILVRPARVGRLGAAQTALSALGLREVPLGADAAARLATLRVETGLKIPDCCVLLAAQDAPTRSVLTFDDQLRTQAQRWGLTST